MRKKLIYFVATAFGLGYFPKIPGTFTSAVVTVLAYYYMGLSPVLYVAVLIFISLIGIYFTGEANRLAGVKDKSMFSLDEVPGQMIALLPIYFTVHSPWLFLIGFGLFRFFDIVKPGLIKRSEGLPGGIGVMADDILSGISAAVCLQIIIILLTISAL